MKHNNNISSTSTYTLQDTHENNMAKTELTASDPTYDTALISSSSHMALIMSCKISQQIIKLKYLLSACPIK